MGIVEGVIALLAIFFIEKCGPGAGSLWGKR